MIRAIRLLPAHARRAAGLLAVCLALAAVPAVSTMAAEGAAHEPRPMAIGAARAAAGGCGDS
jgi:hypothetical protein